MSENKDNNILTQWCDYLTDGQVGRAGISMVDAVVAALGLDHVQHGLDVY